MWESSNEPFDLCQCSRAISDCKINDKCSSFCHISCNKENIHQQLGSPLKHDSELSLYEGNSPERNGLASSLSFNRRIGGNRRPLADHDSNSQDSGYDANSSLSIERDNNLVSLGSIDSLNDEFLDFSDMGPLDENFQLPGDFSTLINGKIQCAVEKKKQIHEDHIFSRPAYKRSISLNIDDTTCNSSPARSCLFRSNVSNNPFKRTDPPIDLNNSSEPKRLRLLADEKKFVPAISLPRPLLKRPHSVSEDVIKSALQRSSAEPDLIGDFSKVFSLPLTPGRHQDLKSISSTTLAMLMRGHFDDIVASYKVIDCRYPYEYDGGHITGAQNIYTKEQIMEELLATNKIPAVEQDSSTRHILIFHCEFSSERGPNLYRFLRNLDRKRNNDVYPSLHYPEVYLLEGGYKDFYEQFSDLCTPEAYKPMLHPDHQHDLRHFRTKAKTWNGDKYSQSTKKGGMKRLDFL